MAKVLLPVLLSIILSGCVGGAVVSNKKVDLGGFSLSSKRGRIVDKNSPFIHGAKNEILDKWGPPDKVVSTGVTEKWYYSHNYLSWKGLFLIAIVPVPLLIPTDHDKLLLTFDGDNLTSIEAISSVVTSGVFCSIFNIHGYPKPQCSFATDKEEQENIDRRIKDVFKTGD